MHVCMFVYIYGCMSIYMHERDGWDIEYAEINQLR